MAFSLTKFLKGIRVYKEGTLTPDNIDIVPNGTASTTTTIQSSQTANRTLTLPDATDTLVGKATTDTFTNKTFDADGAGNSLTNIDNANIKVGAAIDAIKIADGSVDNSEFQRLGAVTSSIVGIDDTQTLSNKTFNDNSTTFQDNADNTKKMQFQVSGVTTGTTRTLTVPDVNTEIMGLAGTQTITGTKTVTGSLNVRDNAFVISDNADPTKQIAFEASNITTGNTRTFFFPDNGGTTILDTSTSATVSNKTLGNSNIVTLRDDRFTLQDSADTTKQAVFELNGITTATTRTMTVPNFDTEIMGLAGTQTVTGTKTFQNTVFTTNPIDLTVGQIKFPSTQAASANANTLDDYEEGTWTPVWSGTSTAGVGTYAIQQGYYTKIGRMVFVNAYVSITNHTGTGNYVLGGLPFTSSAAANNYSTMSIGYSNNLATSANTVPSIYIDPGATSMQIATITTGGGAAGAVAVDTSFAMIYSGCYQAAD